MTVLDDVVVEHRLEAPEAGPQCRPPSSSTAHVERSLRTSKAARSAPPAKEGTSGPATFRCRGWPVPTSPEQRAEMRRIAKEMAKVGFVLPGTLLERRLTCTHGGCHCHDDPPQLHGPYWYWTRKVSAKTVSRVISPEQVEEYRPWIDNERRLRALVRQLEQLGLQVIEDDPRTPRRH
ncbi:MAG: DUF6788 family protein [Acidimicrobiales bacterium]